MLAVFSSIEEDATKQEIVHALEREEVSRGLTFEYCLINMGTIFNRAPSDQAWRKGDVPALDSGGSSAGYIGDLTRMAVLGESDAELVDLLAEVEYIQQAARRPVGSGAKGGDIYIEPNVLVSRSKHKGTLEFVTLGMGLVSHEAPWLTDRRSVPYQSPLEARVVLSIETTIQHPMRGLSNWRLAVRVDDWRCPDRKSARKPLAFTKE
jgi:Xaa-Pro aminopeptidase